MSFASVHRGIGLAFLAVTLCAVNRDAGAAVNQWTRIGPDGGSILAIAPDPVTPTTVYVSTEGGGVFKTTNGGVSWTAINNGMPVTVTRALAVAPSNPQILYAGTAYYGVFKSSDAGATWAAINTNFTYPFVDSEQRLARVNGLAVDPADPSIVYAATELGDKPVYKTTNGGTSWTTSSIGLTGGSGPAQLFGLVIDPVNTSIIYAYGYSGVYKSTDRGGFWVQTGVTISGYVGYPGVYGLAIDRTNSSRLYATLSNYGVYTTTDGAQTWTASNAGLPTVQGSLYPYPLGIAIDPQNPRVLYMTAACSPLGGDPTCVKGEVFKSVDQGASWSLVAIGRGSTSMYPVAITATSPSTVFAGAFCAQLGGAGGVGAVGYNDPDCQGTLYRSSNGGGSWTDSVTGLTNLVVRAVATSPVNAQVIYVATSKGAFKTQDGGQTWNAVNTGLPRLDLYAIVIAPSNPSILYVAPVNAPSAVYRSSDGGANWTAAGNGLITGFGTVAMTSALAVDPTDPNVVYAAASDGLYKTPNGGANWGKVTSGNFKSLFVAVKPGSPSTLYFLLGAGFYQSTDGGQTSTQFSIGDIGALAYDPVTPATMYAASASLGLATCDAGYGIYKTTDNGATWVLKTAGLPRATVICNGVPVTKPFFLVRALAIDPAMPTRVYAGLAINGGSFQGGVYQSSDAGESWTAVGSVPNSDVLSLGSTATTPVTLYAGSNGASVAALQFSPPSVTSVAPASGPTTGGTLVTITGGGFATGASVLFDDQPATTVAVVNATTISAVTPAHAAGAVAVAVTNPEGISASRGQAYTFAITLARMAIDKTSLRFSAVTTGAAFSSRTPAQTVRLTQTGAGTVTWAAASTVPWLVVSPASGSGPAILTISAQFASGLTDQQTGRINLTLTGAGNTVGPIDVTLTTVPATAAASPPFGSFDTPAGDSTVLAGSIALTGWTLDNVGVKQVELWRDLQPGETTPPGNSTPGDLRNGKIFIANATFVDGARPDVEGLYPTTPANYRAGWGYLMLTWGLFGQGNGTYKFYAFGVDQEGNTSTIGTKIAVISNNSAIKPFGSIDTPAIGGDASGPNFGWAVTPKVGGAATCKIQPSGVQYSIDSGPLQPVVYGDARTDIAGAFAGFSNTAAAGGHAIIDWTALTNGSHTIGWLITDDCNRSDGVGSRFFNVTTGTALRTAESAVATAEPPSPVASSRASDTESDVAITVARGYGQLPEIVDPAATGSRTVEMKQGERIEIRVPRGFESAYQLGPSGQRRALPIGATWDADSGTFYWQPAPGFFGRYRLVFTRSSERIGVRVVIVP